MKNKFFIISIVILGIFLAAFLYFKDQFKENSAANASATSEQTAPSFSMVPVDSSVLIKPHSPVKGSPSARVTVVEFLDPECESCSAMNPLVKKIYDEYKSDIKIVVRYMTYHQNSNYVANILEGARAEGKYWEALDVLFENQSLWADHHNPKPELIPEILKHLNLNLTKIIADAKAGVYDKQIAEDMADGKKVGVTGTPTFFVNGTMLEELGYESLKSAIESKLKP